MGIQTVSQALSNENGGFSPFGFKNRIINGAMVIDQRNAGASITPADGGFIVDRWKAGVTQSSKFTAQQNAGSVTSPAGFTKYLGVTSSSSYSALSTDQFYLTQPIEGFNTADLSFGASSASSIAVSFWVRSSLTGTFSGTIGNDAFSRTYAFSFTINSSNTWEYKTITIPGDTTGTWIGATNGTGIWFTIDLGSGSNYATTANTWTAGGYRKATGSTSIVGSSGATLYITGVQLEKGPQATAFDYRDFGRELFLCQRYFEVFGRAIDSSTFAFNSMAAVISQSTSYVCGRQFMVPKRTGPTVAIYSRNGTLNSVSAFNTGSDVTGTWTTNATGAQGFHAVQVAGGSATKGDGYEYGYTASAEL
jgi:hypothetical protein